MKEVSENYGKVNGINLCWFEWGEKQEEQPTFLLVHATGFHARCWDQVVQHLGDQHIVSVDMRGHGRSDNEGPFSWDYFGSDLIGLIEEINLTNIVGVGHSMGGHSVTQAAAKVPQRFERLVLVDPVILSPELYDQRDAIHTAWLTEKGEHPVARRRNHFSDADEMFRNFENKGSYGLWQKQVLRDYCVYGLLPDPELEGSYVLACPPKVEASIYMGSSGKSIYDEISKIDLPVKILRAAERDGERTEMDFSRSPTWNQLAKYFSQGEDVYLPELTHFIPMQDPELTARHILGEV